MTTLAKILMVAAFAPSMTLTQDPPRPAAKPSPATPPTKTAPATPAPKVYFTPDFDYDFKYHINVEPNIKIALEDARMKLQDHDFSFEMQKAEREIERARMEMDRELNRADRDFARDMALQEREMVRANADMARAAAAVAKVSVTMPSIPAMPSMPVMSGFNYRTESFMSATPRQGWAKEDPADSLYRLGREALNRGEYRRGAQYFAEIQKKFPKSQYALDSQYWEAFGRYRVGTTDDLREALKLLDDPKMAGIRSNEYSMDVNGLKTRVLGALAARGDRNAETRLKTEANQSNSCDREEISVRAEALGALGQMDIASALPVVKKVLARRDDCTTELRRRALYVIGRAPNADAVDVLLDVAKNDTDAGIRNEAMSWLSRTAGDKAVPLLEDMLKTSTDEQTQRGAVRALSQIDTDRSRKAIRAIIERTDAQERIRTEAISTLARDRDNRTMAADDIAYLRSLYTKMETQRLKESVLSAASRIESAENEAWLLSIARNENEAPSLRSQALSRLGRMTTVNINDIGKLYESADSRELRQRILRALSERKEPEAMDKLVEVAKKDTDPNIRRYAINILNNMKDNPKALQAIKELVSP